MTAATGSPRLRRRTNGDAPRETPTTRGGRGRDAAARSASDEWLTVEEICTELKISRRTFDRWRARGTGPRCEPLGGHGPLRSRRSWLDAWAENGPDAA